MNAIRSIKRTSTRLAGVHRCEWRAVKREMLAGLDAALRSCAECTIQGFAVARHPDDVGALRFLFGLRVPEADGRRYELLPLDQPWRPEAAE